MVQILVVDDDRHMRTACLRALSAAGWAVTGAETGDEALQLLENKTQKPDVVLLDQLMPGISGMETLSRIQELYPGVPVVIMTGFITEESMRDLKRQGAFDCLAKPFTPEQLRNVVRRALGESAHILPAI